MSSSDAWALGIAGAFLGLIVLGVIIAHRALGRAIERHHADLEMATRHRAMETDRPVDTE